MRMIALLCLAGIASGCTQYVETPDIKQTRAAPVPDAELDAVLARITPPLRGTGVERESFASPRASVGLLRAGQDLGYGVTMTPEAETLWTATLFKDWLSWEEKFDEAKRSLPDTPEAAFLLSAQRLRAMMHAGRMAEARAELDRLEEIERSIFGNVLETTSQYGQLNSWLHNSQQAITYNAAVVDAVGEWWLPEFYYAKPENTGDAKRVAGALMRSHIGLTCEHVVLHEYETAMAWGRAGLDMTESVLGISHHPLYGLFVKPTAYMYEGEAWMMACYAAARIGVSGDVAANQYLIDRAKAFFRQTQYRWSDYLVDSIVNYVLYDTGLKPQETEAIGVLGDPEPVTSERLAGLVRFRPADMEVREDVRLPVPEPDSIKLPGEGALNAYGFEVGAALAEANAAVLDGDYDDAIRRLDRIADGETEPLKRWLAAEQAVKTLILAGRSSEAMARIEDLEQRETAFFGGNLGARALRGEVKFWLGDNDGAERDFLQVVEALGDFRPPSLLNFKPEVPQTALMARAQYLAYLGVARSRMYRGDAANAAPWAEAGEQLFEEIHYIWNHELYRRYLKPDADMFYARGVNLSVLAGARMMEGGDRGESEELMDEARAYLKAMGFDAGLVTIEANWARALLEAGHPEEAASIARRAARFAADNGQVDLLWQVQALRGAALGELGRDDAAEQSLRAAQAAIEAVSGALATDASKRRFGVGKEQITQELVRYSLSRSDYARAFEDMERGRARAFVDMLGDVRLSETREGALVDNIRAVDAQIREAKIRAAAPGRASGGLFRRVGALNDRRAGLIARLRQRDSDLADAMSISNRSLAQVQRALGPKDRLVYTLPSTSGAERVRFLLIERAGARAFDGSLSHDELEAALAAFTSDKPIEDAIAQREAAARVAAGIGLSEWAPAGVLYVVPSRSTYFVPWGALPMDRPTVVLPMGGWLTRAAPARASDRAVVVGAPVLGVDWRTLPGAGEEASDVAKEYGVTPLKGASATRARLRESVGGGVQLLHLATHGVYDARDPLKSAILLSSAGETDRLTAEELFEAPLSAELVVLSACETGLGQAVAGDDFLGLARSFYLGGARAVVNSLWPVYDKPTRLFMTVFYDRAAEGEIGEAWLAARDALKDAGFPAAVYGAFVLGGAASI